MGRRILYVRENKPGGTDTYCKALYEMFKNDEDCQPMPVEDIPAKRSRLFHYYYQSSALKEAIKEADIVHINGYTALGSIQAFLTAKSLHKHIVYTAHWHPFECLRHPLLGKLFFYCIFRYVIKRYADIVTTINNEDTRFFKTIHPHVVQIPHWFNPIALSERPQKKANMILFVGRTDDPVKGLEHLYQLPEGQYEIHCVGRGHIQRKDFYQHIDISAKALAKLYAEASLLVIPSKYEAFSYAALEALSYGTPVLMSERVRIADYLQGIKGYETFLYRNYNDFNRKVERTIGTAVESDKVYQIFSTEEIKKKYLSVYLSF